jgi:UDP-glucose 4-epimerase
MVIPTFVRQALAGQPVTVHGDGTQTRSFASVTDAVRAIAALAADARAVGEVFNVGNDEEVTIADLAARVVALTGSASPIVTVPYAQAYETGFEDMPRRVPDTTKIRNLIGWTPHANLDHILHSVIEYWRSR